MRKIKLIYPTLSLVFLLIVSIGSAFAETMPHEGLSLDQALRAAFVNNPRMLEARQEIKATKGRWIQAEAFPVPEAGIEISGLKNNENGARNGKIGSFGVKQPLDALGTRFLRGSMAKDEVKIAKGELDLVWAEIRSSVIELYFRILAQEKALGIAQNNLDVTRQFFTRVETRFQSGDALQSDTIRAKIEVSRAENEFLVNQKDLKVSNGEMNLVLGRSAETSLQLTDSLTYETLSYQYETVREQALSQRADIRNETIRLKERKKGFWAAILRFLFQ